MKFLLITALSLGLATVALADSAKFDAQMKPLVADYLVIQTALSSDSTDGIGAVAAKIAAAAKKLDATTVTGEHAAHFQALPKKIQAAAAALQKAADIDAARAAFKKLSQPLAMWATMAQPGDLNVVYCSMAKGSWLQPSKELRNPYYGSSMLTCGEIVSGKDAGHADGHMKQ